MPVVYRCRMNNKKIGTKCHLCHLIELHEHTESSFELNSIVCPLEGPYDVFVD